ncbi:MAG: hypothetical protein ACYTAO_15675 [Planctomycetota bacterium]|jgi:hypothetical protein
MIELSATIWNTYERLGLSSDLAWLARGHEGSSIRHTVIDFIRTHGPEAAIRELILPSRAVTEAIADEIYFQILPDEDEEITCRRFLWKFGFDIARYEDDYAILRKRIGEFQKCVLELGSQLSEDDRAKVRSFGVNLFVSVETFLENLLCYNSWLLSSDHFSGAKFSYDKVDSLLSVGKILGDELVSGDETVKWSNNGSNTMGTLLAYLQAFRNWLKGRRDADKSCVVRAEEDFPHYAEDTLWIFPFKHTQLWADASPEVMAAYSELFDGICTQLTQADLPTVRNGLDHKREEEGFPETDRMLACASRIQQVLDIADNKRLIPKLFWETRRERDANENTCHMLLDYRGNTVTLWSPSTLAAQTRMVSSVPCLVAPFDFLNQPNSTLQFTVSTGSTYKEYWENYPRRRVIPSEACGTLVPEKANTEGNVST